MGWIEGVPFPRQQTFSRVQLESITADQVYRWAKLRVYGDPDADEGITQPIHYRVNSVLGWKRAISYSMINTNMQ
jgi:hypothetical protein